MAGQLPDEYISAQYDPRWDAVIVRACHPEARIGPLGDDGGMPVLAEVTVMYSVTRDGEWRRPDVADRPIEVRIALGEGLTATQLQRFSWRRYLNMADAARRQDVEGGLRAMMGLRPEAPQRRGPKVDMAFYEDIAREYTAIRERGIEAPDKAIARDRGAKRNTVAGWIRKCRQLGLLPPARPGRAG